MTATPASQESAVARAMELAFPVLLVIFSLAYLWAITGITEPPRNIWAGPRTFPLMVGAMMLLVSLMLVRERLRARATGSSVAAGLVVPAEESETSVSDWPAVWLTLAAMLALFMLLERLGFVVAISLFLFALPTFFAPRRWLTHLVTALSFSLIFYYLFTGVLEIPLPVGILSFMA